jgi:anthranilate synthase component 2
MNDGFGLGDTDLHDRVLVVDNYDSFTFNLVQYLGELGARCTVIRNDTATVAEVAARRPAAVVISPGPGTPRDAGICIELIRAMGEATPILGVCLGHQAIGEAYGGRVVRAPVLMHGKLSHIHHANGGIFAGLPSPLTATRYHSLIVDRDGLPRELQVTAWTADSLIMGLRHSHHRVEGVQFHPESIGTATGRALLGAFLDSADVPRSTVAA